jgi:hypothetical protein
MVPVQAGLWVFQANRGTESDPYLKAFGWLEAVHLAILLEQRDLYTAQILKM